MSVGGYLDKRAERRDAYRLLLIDRGLDARSLLRLTFQNLDARLFVAFTIIGLFAWAFARTTDPATQNLMVGALVAAFAGAWGYYLGSSSNAAKAGERADKGLDLAHEALRRPAVAAPGSETGTVDILSDDEKAEIERLIGDNDLAALQRLAAEIPEAAGKTDPREIATLVVKSRRA